jgi:glutamate/tyrosine decarboxylase-like PLP-dependent enzyme
MTRDEVLAALAAMRSGDRDWRNGRCFALVFHAGDDVEEIAREASVMYLAENGLNPLAFPSLGRMQEEVVDVLADLTHGRSEGRAAAGFMTSGGTESILLAVRAARDRARVERGVERPNLVLGVSAHAAFHKAAHDYGLEVRRVPVRDDWRVDTTAMAEAIDADTALVVGSAPQYPQGVIDPIPEIAELAARAGTSCHVDACMGGFVLPFMERLGYPVAPWDFRVEGVTSISADVHKLGYSPKGASVLLHRTEAMRRHQVFLFDDWLGGFYASSGLLGTRAAGPIAAAWAVIHFLGEAGYLRLVDETLDATRRMVAGVRAIPGLRVLGEPDAHLVAIAAIDPDAIDVFAVMDVLGARGWHLDRQRPPDSIHATISAGTATAVDPFLADLRAAVEAVGDRRTDDRSTDYAPLPEA